MLFARALAARSLDGEMTVESAGTSARGQQVPAELLEILDERGVDLSSHRGRELGASMLLQADLVIALPCYESLTDEEIERIKTAFLDILGTRK
jgi:protein-tyrosine-phosphatase